MAQLIDIAALRRRPRMARPGQEHGLHQGESRAARRMHPVERAVDAIATLTWHARARFFDRLVGEGLAWMDKELGRRDLGAGEAHHFLRGAIADLRGTLTDILDRLDRVAPLAPDGDAMRIFRVSDDPRRIAEAQRYWGGAEAERRGMMPASNLTILRNMMIRLEM